MPVIVRLTSVAANAIDDNVISGSAFEFARGNILVSLGVAQSATGLFVTLNAGSDIVAEEFEPIIKTTYPLIPDEFYFNEVSVQGDRLVVRARNSTGGALTLRTIVQITNLN